MLKEFFLVDYTAINKFKEISAPLLDIATSSFLLIASIFELFKGFVGKSNVESRITIFILAAISLTAFNQYNQKVLDISFETSDKILSSLHITSMAKISDIMKSSPADQINKSSESKTETKKTKTQETVNILGEARLFMANNLAIALAWLISVIAIGLSRILFTVIYYSLIVLSPIVIFISVFPGYEASLKAFWQAFIWCFLAPIVFSVVFVLMHIVAQNENHDVTGLESLINVLLYGIFLIGSFIITYKISTAQPLSGFAEKASMVGAMAMAAPFTSVSSFAQSAIHSPLKTYGNTKESLNFLKKGVSKISQSAPPHSGITDIKGMNKEDLTKKFGSKVGKSLYATNSKNNYLGNQFGLSPSANTGTSFDSGNSSKAQGLDLNKPRYSIDPNTLKAVKSADKANYTNAPESKLLNKGQLHNLAQNQPKDTLNFSEAKFKPINNSFSAARSSNQLQLRSDLKPQSKLHPEVQAKTKNNVTDRPAPKLNTKNAKAQNLT